MINPTLNRCSPLFWCTILVQLFSIVHLNAQTVIGGDTIDQSAILDIQDTAKGVLLTRLTTTQRNTIPKPAFGLLILNTTRKCLEANIGSPDTPDWQCLTTGIPKISEVDTAYWNRKLGAGDTLSLSARINAKLSPGDTLSLSNRIDGKLSSFTESDPVFNSSIAKGITGADTLYWNRKLDAGDTLSLSARINAKLSPADTLSLSNRIDVKLSSYIESDPVFNSSIAKGITISDTLYWNRKLEAGDTLSLSGRIEAKIGLPPTGNNLGNILYWNGTAWVRLSPGLPGQALVLSQEGTPIWTGAALATIATNAPNSITPTSATVSGQITADGGANISAVGIVWSTNANPTLSSNILTLANGTGSFSGILSGLLPNTIYYIRAYATNSAGTAYGTQQSFTTLPISVPTLTTNGISSITQTNAITGGNITNDGGATVTQRGVVYGTTQNPTLSNAFTQDGNGTGNFTSTLSGLTANTTYYVRAYAANSAGTSYGNQQTFVTQIPTVPSLSTREVINVTNATATSGGTISNDGGSTITAKGVVWATTANPTLSNTKTSDETGMATYASFLTGLSSGVTYYVRAYATNSTGTGYGNQLSFTTSLIPNTLPVVTSVSVTGLTTTQANLNAEVVSQGGGEVTERGAVWNTTGNPTVNSNRIPFGTGTGGYIVKITGLSNGSNYYVRAYAINNFGITYGEEIPFMTSAAGLPTLSTSMVTTKSTEATSGGIITDNGGFAIITKGVVWSTSGGPTLSDNRTVDGAGQNSFQSNLSGLIPNTTYYLRAYATNTIGTGYGNEITFTTDENTLTDIDGNSYSTIKIGTQIWMSENLRTTRYKNGDPIPYVVGNTEWSKLTTGAWSNYSHDEENGIIYGKLYNWYAAADIRGICPLGWHIPSDVEWNILLDYLGGRDFAGGKMKTIGTIYWNSPNEDATNESGFSALPAGFRHSGGSFSNLGVSAWFWSRDGDDNVGSGRALSLNSNFVNNIGDFGTGYSLKFVGTSLRCLKD